MGKDAVEPLIYWIRGQRVMLDADLAAIYGVHTSRFNEDIYRKLLPLFQPPAEPPRRGFGFHADNM